MELNRQALSEGELTGVAPLNWENETRMRMRLQTVDIPPALQNLGLQVEVVAPRQAAAGMGSPPVTKSPPISIIPVCQNCIIEEPPPAHMDTLIYRVMAGSSLVTFPRPAGVNSTTQQHSIYYSSSFRSACVTDWDSVRDWGVRTAYITPSTSVPGLCSPP